MEEEIKENQEAAPESTETVVETPAPEAAAETATAATEPGPTATAPTSVEKERGSRAEKVGIVTSDKMTRTVVVRVDRLVKHPVYKRYVRRRTKFMAHNEIDGVTLGDTVRIVETRPLSARKRWRVVEVLRKASR